ncbi:MAG: hypothetical protein ACTS73_07655 [Arsenophonus sp. NEOnobi-MAG3]
MTGLLLTSSAIIRIDFTHSLMLFFALISLFYLGTFTEKRAHKTLSALHW